MTLTGVRDAGHFGSLRSSSSARLATTINGEYVFIRRFLEINISLIIAKIAK